LELLNDLGENFDLIGAVTRLDLNLVHLFEKLVGIRLEPGSKFCHPLADDFEFTFLRLFGGIQLFF
jgi:hypothetical protein